MRGLSEGVKDIIYAYYTNIHQNNLSIIMPADRQGKPAAQVSRLLG